MARSTLLKTSRLLGQDGDYIDCPLAYKSTLKGLFVFDDKVSTYGRNWVKDGHDAQIIGSPSRGVGGNGGIFQQGINQLLTDILEAPNMTIIATIAKPATAGAAFVASTYFGARSASDGTNANGTSIQLTAAGSNQVYSALFSSYDGTAGHATANAAASMVPSDAAPGNKIIALRTSEPAGTIKIKDLTNLATAEVTATRASGVRDINSLPFVIGGNQIAAVGSIVPITIYDIAFIQETVSTDELLDQTAWSRDFWARRGVVV